jgi:hypothetical protein
VAGATQAMISSQRIDHIGNVGKQAPEQNGKFRVNKNDEEKMRPMKFVAAIIANYARWRA